MDKTIKQLADEIGVSKTAINKKIDNLGLWKQLSKVGGQWFIPSSAEKSIKEAFNRKPKSKTVTNNQSETVAALVATFQKQLEAKDKQIENLQQLLDHEQQLHAMTQQKLLALQDEKEVDADSDQDPHPEEPTPEKKKKWWQRLF